MKATSNFSIFTDGAARGNPGPAAAAFIFVKNDKVLYSDSYFLGDRTNNQAEYQAIIKALEIAIKYTKENIVVVSDSELVIRQLNGDYKVKNPQLRLLYREVMSQIQNFSLVKFSHVPRTDPWIIQVDQLCKKILTRQS